MNVIIDRKKWLRGDDITLLLDKSQKMCCLGFLGRACGIPSTKDGLLQRGTPDNIPREYQDKWIKGVIAEERNTRWTHCAMVLNDSLDYTESIQREQELIVHFARIGVTLSFIN